MIWVDVVSLKALIALILVLGMKLIGKAFRLFFVFVLRGCGLFSLFRDDEGFVVVEEFWKRGRGGFRVWKKVWKGWVW